MLVGERVTVGAIPVPVRGTVCGVPAALSPTEMLAVRMPAATGVKVALMVHDAPTATEAPQLLDCM